MYHVWSYLGRFIFFSLFSIIANYCDAIVFLIYIFYIIVWQHTLWNFNFRNVDFVYSAMYKLYFLHTP